MSMPSDAANPVRRSLAARLTVAGLLAWPLTEIVVAVLVGRLIGGPLTVLLLVLLSLLGAAVLRRAGARALRSLAPARGAPGGPDLSGAADAGWVLLGGLLLTVPGFVSAVVGVLLVLTPTRRTLAPLLGRGAGRLAERLVGVPLVGRVVGTRVVQGDVVDATVVDVEVVPPTAPHTPPTPQLGAAPPSPPATDPEDDRRPRR